MDAGLTPAFNTYRNISHEMRDSLAGLPTLARGQGFSSMDLVSGFRWSSYRARSAGAPDRVAPSRAVCAVATLALAVGAACGRVGYEPADDEGEVVDGSATHATEADGSPPNADASVARDAEALGPDGASPVHSFDCPGGNCTSSCHVLGGACEMSCQGGGCSFECEAERCDLTCRGGDCDMRCIAGDCDASCQGGNCHLSCEEGVGACSLDCASTCSADCDADRCDVGE